MMNLILLFLIACSSKEFTERSAPVEKPPVQINFEQNCSFCHGLDGMGFDAQKTVILNVKFKEAANDPKCMHCHGSGEYTIATPRLAGQRSSYIEASLRAFRSGERINGHMNEVAKVLTDKEIAELAKYLHGLKEKD